MICQECARNVAQNKTNSTMKFLVCLLILFSGSVCLVLFKYFLSCWFVVCHFYVPVIERNKEGKEEKGIETGNWVDKKVERISGTVGELRKIINNTYYMGKYFKSLQMSRKDSEY